MREVQGLNVTYSKEDYVSVFVGLCESEELLAKYMKKDYELLEDDYIGFELGVDFGINTYDEDFMVMVWNENESSLIDAIFKDAVVFDINKLKELYPDGLNEPYNAAIIIGELKYDGQVQEVHNKEFGYFKFLGVFKLD